MARIELNKEQEAAAASGPGPKLVLAGPGTGKTRVITARIIKLVESGVDPEAILALTFSRRAADEMRDRVERSLSSKGDSVQISTFHAFCADFLRSQALDAAMDPFFDISTRADAIRIMIAVAEENEFHYINMNPKLGVVDKLIDYFSRLKEECVTADELIGYIDRRISSSGREEELPAADGRLREAALAFTGYERKLREAGLMDFGDLIIKTIDLLDKEPAVRKKLQKQYQHVLVDEFQDTNFAQARLLDRLTTGHRNLFVVGDDDQSIYRWRGASLKNILDFKKNYPDAKTVKLRLNYRSGDSIIMAAKTVVGFNTERWDKPLDSASRDKGTVSVNSATAPEDEASFVAGRIIKLLKETNDSIAILFRSVKSDAGLFLEELDRHKLPYTLTAAGAMWQSESVRDLIAWIRLLSDPYDTASLARTLTGYPVNLDALDFIDLRRENRDGKATDILNGVDKLSPEAQGKTKTWLWLFKTLANSKNRDDIGKYVREVSDAIGVRVRLLESDTAEARRQLVEVAQFEKLAEGFGRSDEAASLERFCDSLDWMAGLRMDPSEGDDRELGVRILTIHAAKGLEFDHVFLPNLTKRRMPGRRLGRMFDIPAELLKEELKEADAGEIHNAEARRLFFVGLSRARKSVSLSYARRMRNGVEIDEPSPYLEEICAALDISPEPASPAIRGEETSGPALKEVIERLCLNDGFINFGQLDKEAAAEIIAADIGRLMSWRMAQSRSSAIEDGLSGNVIEEAVKRIVTPKYQNIVTPKMEDAVSTASNGAGFSVQERSFSNIAKRSENAPALSVSDIKTYQRCPLQFRYRSIDKIPGQPDTARELGTMIHQVLQRWHSAGPRTEARLELLLELAEKGFNRIPSKRRPGNEAREMICDALRGYFESFVAQANEPVYFEKSFSFAIGDATVKGRVDRVDRTDAGSLELIDYKTGKTMSRADIKKDLQLPLYYLGARQSWGLEPAGLRYSFIFQNEEVCFMPSAEALAEAENTVIEISEGILGGRFEPEPEFNKCRFCDYVMLCPAHERRIPGVPG